MTNFSVSTRAAAYAVGYSMGTLTAAPTTISADAVAASVRQCEPLLYSTEPSPNRTSLMNLIETASGLSLTR
jgi:hypothetical protein